MPTIVIGDGLTKEFLGTEQPFAASPFNVGGAEIDRLLGRSKAYGNGPLPSFLRAVVAAEGSSGGPRLIVLRGNGPTPEILEPVLAEARVLPSSSDVIPWRDLWGEVSGQEASGSIDGPSSLPRGRMSHRASDPRAGFVLTDGARLLESRRLTASRR